MMSSLFSKLFYGIKIYSYDLLNYNIKRLLDFFYYKCLRVVINDFENLVNRDVIDNTVKRATSWEFSNFCLAKTVIKLSQM